MDRNQKFLKEANKKTEREKLDNIEFINMDYYHSALKKRD